MRATTVFLEGLITASPCLKHTVLSGHGIQFADLPKYRKEPTARSRGNLLNRLGFCMTLTIASPSHLERVDGHAAMISACVFVGT